MSVSKLTVDSTSVPDPVECVDTEQVDASFHEGGDERSLVGFLIYGALGLLFGIAVMKSEVASWYRIQEMFRFQSFHMYGIIGSAIIVAAAGIRIIQRFDIRTMTGRPIRVAPKEWDRGTRYWAGGIIFGFGWALLGACPAPIFALIGSGLTVMVVALFSALAGTWLYGVLRSNLPH